MHTPCAIRGTLVRSSRRAATYGLKPSAAARPRATATVPRAGVRSTRPVQGSAAALASTQINEHEEAQKNVFFVSFLGLFCVCILMYVGFCLRLALNCSRPRVLGLKVRKESMSPIMTDAENTAQK